MTSPGSYQGHALIVAVAAYRFVKPLPGLVLKDARDVTAVLTSPERCGYDPENVTQLLDGAATRAAILAGLKDLASRAGPQDTACVYFSGHGALIGGSDADESCLAPVDCRVDDLVATSISAFEFSDALHAIKSERLIVFLDACHASGAGSLKSVLSEDGPALGYSEKTLVRLASGKGRALMASSRPSETSLIMPGASNSAFTAALLEGLDGAADQHADGLIKVFDLFDYIARRVPQTTADAQHPNFKASNLEQNFPIALSRGGAKNLSAAQPLALVKTDQWNALNTILPSLYPNGPSDQEIWERAGGDASRLRLQGTTGRGAWFAALRTLERGGGGGSIDFDSLVEAALADFPNHPELPKLRRH